MTINVGDRIGDYTVTALLGGGGSGSVVAAERCRDLQRHALKLIPVQGAVDPDIVRRIEREFKIGAHLRHPNIVFFHSGFQYPPFYVLAMDLVEGQTLANILRAGPMSPRDALGFAQKIAAPIAYAHRQGIFHRDIKPQNIMVKPDGEVVVVDLGIAIASALTRITHNGHLSGTPEFMSPEAVLNRGFDERSDVYSLGATLYRMLVGQPLFNGEVIQQLNYQTLNVIPAAPHVINPQVAESTSLLVMKALEKDPAKRFQNMDAFAAAIALELNPQPLISPALHPLRRGVVFAAAGLFAASTALNGYLLLDRQRLQRSGNMKAILVSSTPKCPESPSANPAARANAEAQGAAGESEADGARSTDQPTAKNVPMFKPKQTRKAVEKNGKGTSKGGRPKGTKRRTRDVA